MLFFFFASEELDTRSCRGIGASFRHNSAPTSTHVPVIAVRSEEKEILTIQKTRISHCFWLFWSCVVCRICPSVRLTGQLIARQHQMAYKSTENGTTINQNQNQNQQVFQDFKSWWPLTWIPIGLIMQIASATIDHSSSSSLNFLSSSLLDGHQRHQHHH